MCKLNQEVGSEKCKSGQCTNLDAWDFSISVYIFLYNLGYSMQNRKV
jgi:hypothetical protein